MYHLLSLFMVYLQQFVSCCCNRTNVPPPCLWMQNANKNIDSLFLCVRLIFFVFARETRKSDLNLVIMQAGTGLFSIVRFHEDEIILAI